MAESSSMKVKVLLHVPKPIHRKLRSIDPTNCVYGVALLSSNSSADHVTTTPDIESMQHLGLTGECWIIGEVVNNHQYLKITIVSSILHDVGDLMMSI